MVRRILAARRPGGCDTFRPSFHRPPAADLRVLVFTLAAAVGTGLVFSLLPLARLARLDLNDTLKQSGARIGEGRGHARAQCSLIVCEVAISVTLLVGTTLLIESLYRMHQEKLGFEPGGVIALQISVGKSHRQSGAARWDFERSVLERFQALSAAPSVASVSMLPLTGQNNLPTQLVGKPENSIGGMEYRAVTSKYFQTLGIPVLEGRGFQLSDTRSSPNVAVISESVARQWFPAANPIGEQLQVGRYQDHELREIEESPPRNSRSGGRRQSLRPSDGAVAPHGVCTRRSSGGWNRGNLGSHRVGNPSQGDEPG